MPEIATENQINTPVMNDQEIEEMIKAGVHFGHSKTKRDPAMSQYIFGTRNNVEIIDLVQTKEKLKQSLDFIKNLASKGKTILLVGTQPAAKKVIEETGEEANMPKVSLRWIGGTLTNFKVISKRIETLERLEKEKATGEFEKYTKKERLDLDREIASLKTKFEGIRNMSKLPDAVLILDIKKDLTCAREARRKGIKIIGVVDTNIDPTLVDYLIPGNDDAISSIKYILEKIQETILNSKI